MSGNVNVDVNAHVQIGIHRIMNVRGFEEKEDLDYFPKKKSRGTNVSSVD